MDEFEFVILEFHGLYQKAASNKAAEILRG